VSCDYKICLFEQYLSSIIFHIYFFNLSSQPLTTSFSFRLYIDNRYICRRYNDKEGGSIIKQRSQEPEAFLPLTPAVFHILLALSDGDRHGYGIMQWRTDGQVRMGPGTLYGSIKRMLADGLIEETEARPDPDGDDERRRYYHLTNLGQRVVRAEASRLHHQGEVASEMAVNIIRDIYYQDQEHDIPIALTQAV
jgi:DNA-binding PadR family transcriptional regulator